MPTTANALQKDLRGIYNGYFAKFDSNGVFIYGTYIGGSGFNKLYDLKIDNEGYIYAVGLTDAVFDFPITQNALQKNYGGGEDDVFLCKIKPDGSDFVFSTFIGGKSYDEAYSLTLDSTNAIYITGLTASDNFPTTANAFQTFYKGYEDGFVMKISSDGKYIYYSTYIGGRSNDTFDIITVNLSGEAFTGGRTNSIDFPVTPGTFRTLQSGDSLHHIVDYIITKLSNDGSKLLLSTFLSPEEDMFAAPRKIQLVLNKQIMFAGNTASNKLPVTLGAFQKIISGENDGFVMILDSTFSNMLYCSYLGGSGGKYEMLGSSVVTNDGKLIIAGQTESPDFPITPDAIKKSLTGLTDIFLSIFDIRNILDGTRDETQEVFDLSLKQNFPNPFSSSTMIKIEISRSYNRSFIQGAHLKVFDVLGREVLDLSNELERSLIDGAFVIKLASFQFPKSGIYFYQLTFYDSHGAQKLTKKMNVLR